MQCRSTPLQSDRGPGRRAIRRRPRGRATLQRASLLILLCAGLPGLPALAATAEEESTAREHYAKGKEAFGAGRYEEASREFEQGYALCQRPRFLLNMAHAERRRGELRHARELYQRYIEADPQSKVRAAVLSVLKQLDRRLAGETSGPDPFDSQGSPPMAETPAPVASAPADGATVDALLRVADRRLYEAKGTGRSKIIGIG